MQGPAGEPVVPVPGIGFILLTIITLTAGTAFIMWLGEQITERVSATAYRSSYLPESLRICQLR
jgi:hypothetical protein